MSPVCPGDVQWAGNVLGATVRFALTRRADPARRPGA